MPVTMAGFVFSVGEVETPMATVLDRPVAANRAGELLHAAHDEPEYFLITDLDMAVSLDPLGDGREQRFDPCVLSSRVDFSG